MKRFLAVLTICLLILGCATTLKQGPVKPPVIVVDTTEFAQIAKSYMEKAYKSTELFNSYKEGIKADYDLDLQKLEAIVEVMGADDDGTYVVISLEVRFVAYCLDSQGLHKRVVGILLMVLGVDKESKEVIGGQMIGGEIKILDNWNGLKDL